MSGSIPYLGSKISLISKSEIRYEGILYTIDAQESIIALAKVRSFGTEDRPTEMPVPARDEVYEYIIFRGTDIKTIEVCDTPKVSSLHNDPAIVQHSAPTVVSAGPASTGSAVGASFQQSSFHRQSLGPIGGAIGSGIGTYSSGSGFGSAQSQQQQQQQQQQQSSVIQPSFMSGSSQPNILADVLSGSRSSTPALRKSPVSDAGVQVSPPTVQSPAERKPLPQRQQNIQERQQREAFAQRRPIGGNQQYNRDNQNYQHQQREYQGYNRDFQRNDARDYREHQQRDFREKIRGDVRDFNGDHRLEGRDFRDQRIDGREYQRVDGRDYYREGGQGGQHGQRENQGFHRDGGYQGYRENHPGNYQNRSGGYLMGGYQGGYYPQQMHMMNRGGGRMSKRPNPGRGARGGFPGARGGKQDTTQYDKEFDFEQANEEFEELRTQLAKAKISDKVSEDGDVKDVEHKEDSGHETAPGEDSEDSASSTTCYDKTKSFFDTISCEAIERSKGRSQRPDWRQERKINVQTFGVATTRRGFYQRGRGGYYNNNRGGYYNNNRNSFGNQGYYNNRSGGQGFRGNTRGALNENSVSNGPTEVSGDNAPVPTSTYASTVRNSTATEAAAK